MTPERYQDLLIDNAVFPIGLNNTLLIRSPSDTMVIEIFCISADDYRESFQNYKSRLILMVYPFANLPEGVKVLQALKPKLLILIDCEESDRAFTYQLLINEQDQTASIAIHDMPEQGKMFIPESDIIGITKKIWTPCLKKDLTK